MFESITNHLDSLDLTSSSGNAWNEPLQSETEAPQHPAVTCRSVYPYCGTSKKFEK